MSGPAATAAAYVQSAWRLARRQAANEWRALPIGSGRGRPPRRLQARPVDLRPTDAQAGQDLLAGRFSFSGQVLDVGPGGDPFDRASPSRAFAIELHRFAWLPDLAAAGEAGGGEALRLFFAWERLFGRPNAFAWSPEVLERRVFNLACGLGPMLAASTDVEATRVLGSLATQTGKLLAARDRSGREAERTAAAATAAAAFDGASGDGPLKQALAQLTPALRTTVLADGGHRSRSPEAGLELLFDLVTLDGALQERGAVAPEAVSTALDRLRTGLRFFVQPNGRLPAFHGGRAVAPSRVMAAFGEASRNPGAAPDQAPHTGYQRLNARTLKVMVDAGPPAEGDWSSAATAHAMALEVFVGREPLIISGRSGDHVDARLTSAGSTGSIAEDSLGEVLTGFPARGLGPRLVGGVETVELRRSADAEFTLWVELSHHGWVRQHGFIHERRLFVDVAADELRGEDKFTPGAAQPTQKPFAVRFHLAEGVRAEAAADGRSVELRTQGGGRWRLRHDAHVSAVENGAIVLRGHIQPQGGVRLRWKLSPDTA